jgi:hypothetical protein
VSTKDLLEALNGPKGAIDAYLEVSGEREIRDDIRALMAPSETPTKRELFAVRLFAAMITTSGGPALLGIGPGEDQMARAAVKLADVLLDELAKDAP